MQHKQKTSDEEMTLLTNQIMKHGNIWSSIMTMEKENRLYFYSWVQFFLTYFSKGVEALYKNCRNEPFERVSIIDLYLGFLIIGNCSR